MLTSKTLHYFAQRLRELTAKHPDPDTPPRAYEERCGGRTWEDYYRRRWQHDKVVRSTHGVNCTGSCSFDVFVKDGIIVWEAQKTDYPTPHPDFPDYEPRGCPRGVSASWYVYSPLRVRYPYIRGTLLDLWNAAKKDAGGDPVRAWRAIQSNPAKRTSYQQARGKGGFVRFSWDEAAEMIAASLIYTIQEHGPDRIFGFTPLPAMSMTSFASGARFLTMIGASMVSFYDWYCDLPPASPQIWGEQTDVPESADWYNAGYIISWGSNLPQTRTPDAHFFVEARYRGTRITAISPDYADFTKFADHWLPVRAGTDGALAMAMDQVVLKEFFLERRVPYFEDYAKRFTDLPFLLLLEDSANGKTPGRCLRASDLGMTGNNPQWKFVVYDQKRKGTAIPMGSIGSRYGEEGTWNLEMRDCTTREPLDPLLSFADLPAEDSKASEVQWVQVTFPVFGTGAPESRTSTLPCLPLVLHDGETTRTVLVTTVFDILAGSLAIDRGHSLPGDSVATSYDDAAVYATPAWQEERTGVPRADVIRVAREFAENAERTKGRSMIIMGAGINHWYNNDVTYRAILTLTTLCGCQGVSGGGWAHYVGQEKVRPLAGWETVTMGKDWTGPPRLHNGTSFYYFATDAWRYELLNMKTLCPPSASGLLPGHPADCNAQAVRLGWLPFYPQFGENPLTVCDKAQAAGADTDEAIIKYAVNRLKSGDLSLAVDDPDHPHNIPRVMLFWRANPLGSNVKGHEYFLRHMLGTENAVLAEPSPHTPHTVKSDTPPQEGGKLDLMVTSEIRMSTTCVYSDIVLPAAHWYEY
ncbi:MAG: molybdopterin-dependent oxidoreductase, partial [Bilophila sp.]